MADPKFVIPARLPAAPEKYERINEQKFRRILELALRNVEPAGTSEEVIQSGVLPIRLNKRFIANPSGNTGYATGEIEFEDCAGMFMLKVAMDMQSFADYGQCWLRIYASEADRTADEDRLIDDPLTDGLRILLDVVFEDPDDLEFRLFTIDCEGIPAFNWDDPSLPKLYYRQIGRAHV